MHPVLIYGIVFIFITVGLLFLFDSYPIGSGYLLFLIATVVTAIIGKILVIVFPSEDPMQAELKKEVRKQRSNSFQREIQLIFNIVQPDPKFQPTTKRISESLAECFDLEEEILLARLKQYFGDSFDLQINQPLPDLVEEINLKYKDWLNP